VVTGMITLDRLAIICLIFTFIVLVALTIGFVAKSITRHPSAAPGQNRVNGKKEKPMVNREADYDKEETVAHYFRKPTNAFIGFMEISPLTEAKAMSFIEGKVREWGALKALVGDKKDTKKVEALFYDKLRIGSLSAPDKIFKAMIEESSKCYVYVRLYETMFNKPEKLSDDSRLVNVLIEYVGALENVIDCEEADRKSGWLKEMSRPRMGWKNSEFGSKYTGTLARRMTVLVSFSDYHKKYHEFDNASKYEKAKEILEELSWIEKGLEKIKLGPDSVWAMYIENAGIKLSAKAKNKLKKCNGAKKQIEALIKQCPSFNKALSLADTEKHIDKILKKIEEIDASIKENGASLAYKDVKDGLTKAVRKKREGLRESLKGQVARFCKEEIDKAMKLGVDDKIARSRRIKKFNGTMNRVLKKVDARDFGKASREEFYKIIDGKANKYAGQTKSLELGNEEVGKLFQIAHGFYSVNKSGDAPRSYKKIQALNDLVDECVLLERKKTECETSGDISNYKESHAEAVKKEKKCMELFDNSLHSSYREFLTEMKPEKVESVISAEKIRYKERGKLYSQYFSLFTAIHWENKYIKGNLLTKYLEDGLPDDQIIISKLLSYAKELNDNRSGQNNLGSIPKEWKQKFYGYIEAMVKNSNENKYYEAFCKGFKKGLNEQHGKDHPLKRYFNKAIKNEEVRAIVEEVLDCLNIEETLRDKVLNQNIRGKGASHGNRKKRARRAFSISK